MRLTHPDKVLFPDPGITKRQLADYWLQVADVALPLLRGRPLTLFRCPDGYAAQCFYQKHVGAGVPAAVPRVAITEGEDPYAAIDERRVACSRSCRSACSSSTSGARAPSISTSPT